MITINLTGITFQDLSDEKVVLLPASAPNTSKGFKGTCCRCRWEPNEHASDGKALAVYHGNSRLGFIPELEKAKNPINTKLIRIGMKDKLDHPCYIDHMLYKEGDDTLLDYEEVRDITKDSVSVASITVRFEKKEGSPEGSQAKA